MPRLSPSEFAPELVSTMRSVLDTAVDQIDKAHRTPATKARWQSTFFKRFPKALLTFRNCSSRRSMRGSSLRTRRMPLIVPAFAKVPETAEWAMLRNAF